MPKLVRVLVYEGPDDWLTYEKDHMRLSPYKTWNVAASASAAGGGGSITEVFRGSPEEFTDEVKKKLEQQDQPDREYPKD